MLSSKSYWAVMLLATTVSVVLGVLQIILRGNDFLVGDGLYWHLAATYVAEGRGFIHPIVYLGTGSLTPAADHPPLFILYLAFFSKIGLGSVFAHQVATALLAGIAVSLFGILARLLGGTRLAIYVMPLASVHPLMWGWSPHVMSEPLAVIMVMILFIFTFHVYKQKKSEKSVIPLTYLVILGASIGVATLTRSELLLTGGIILTVVTFSKNLVAWIKRVLIASIAVVVTLSPWVGYNLSRFEKPVYLSIGSDITFASAYCDDTFYGDLIGYWSYSCQQKAWDYANDRVDVKNPDQSELMPYVKEYWQDYLSNNLHQAVKVVPLRIGRALGLYKPAQQMNLEQLVDGKSKEVTYGAWFLFYGLTPVALLGLLKSKLDRTQKLLLLTPVMTSIIVVGTTWGNPRYRFSIDIVLIILGALGLLQITSLRRKKLKTTANEEETSSVNSYCGS